MNNKKAHFHPVEEYLSKYWDKSFTLQELVDLNLGEKHVLHYRLNNSKYVYKVSHGRYQFTAWRRKGFTSVKAAVLAELEENSTIIIPSLAKKLCLCERTIVTAIENLRKDGYCITSARAFTIHK